MLQLYRTSDPTLGLLDKSDYPLYNGKRHPTANPSVYHPRCGSNRRDHILKTDGKLDCTEDHSLGSMQVPDDELQHDIEVHRAQFHPYGQKIVTDRELHALSRRFIH